MEESRLPDGWRNLSLGTVAQYVNGRAFKPSEWKKTGLPIIRIQNLNDSQKQFNYFDGEYEKKHYIENGDILISWSASLGVYVWERGPALLNQHIFKVRPNQQLIDRAYFVYAVRTILDQMKSRVHGSTMRHIVKGDFQSLKIPVPPLPLQRRIANVLERARRLQRIRAQANQLTSKIIQSVFLKIFGDPVTNTFKFPTAALGELAVMSRYGPRFYNQPYSDSGVPILRTTDITEQGELSLENAPKLDVSDDDLAKYRMRAGDVVISRSGSLGRCAVFETEGINCIPGAFLLHFRFGDRVLPEYIQHYVLFPSIQRRIREMGRFVAQPNVNATELKSLVVPIPPLDSQRKFSQFKTAFKLTKERQGESTREISSLSEALMYKAFRGELRVS